MIWYTRMDNEVRELSTVSVHGGKFTDLIIRPPLSHSVNVSLPFCNVRVYFDTKSMAHGPSSRYGHHPGMRITQELFRNAEAQAPDLVTQDLHFNKIPTWLLFTI